MAFHSHGGTPSSLDGLPSCNLLQFAIENGSLTVHLPIPNGDFHSYVNVYQRVFNEKFQTKMDDDS